MERGRPKTIGDRIRERICLIARTSPLGLGHHRVLHLIAEHAGGISWRGTTTWKASTDPDFIARMRRVLDLYDHPPDDGRVICRRVRPTQPVTRKGKAWRPQTRPQRAAGHLQPQRRRDAHACRTRPRHRPHLLPDPIPQTPPGVHGLLFKALRTCWLDEKLYVVCDNFSPRRHADVRTWCAGNQVELVFVPTYSQRHRPPQLHRAEPAIGACIRWHNARAVSKT